MVLASKQIGERFDHPEEDGVWAEMRVPTWGQYLVLSQFDQKSTEQHAMNSVLSQCVLRWSYDNEEITAERIADIDFNTFTWLALQAVELGTPTPKGKDQGSSPDSPKPLIPRSEAGTLRKDSPTSSSGDTSEEAGKTS